VRSMWSMREQSNTGRRLGQTVSFFRARHLMANPPSHDASSIPLWVRNNRIYFVHLVRNRRNLSG